MTALPTAIARIAKISQAKRMKELQALARVHGMEAVVTEVMRWQK